MGFYMDADVVSTDAYGNFGVHTNDDDFMEYYDCANPDIVPEGCKVINDDKLLQYLINWFIEQKNKFDLYNLIIKPI